MKAYTDIPQSKKLAEILPLDSADSVIVSIGDREGVKTITVPKETFNILRTPFTDIRNTISCWSLAALLEVLPDYTLQTTTDGKVFVVCEGKQSTIISSAYHNPVDACVDMILLLKERSLI